MADAASITRPPESRQFSIRLPHWGWFLLATVVLVVAVVGLRIGVPIYSQHVANGTDFELIELVVVDLIDFKEFDTEADFGRKKLQVVLSRTTAGSTGVAGPSGFLSDDQLAGESRNTTDQLIPPGITTDLRRRNPKEPISLSGFRPTSKNILVADVTDLNEFEFEKEYPEARGFVEPWLPGYSKDGKTAVVRVWLGPTAHGATATYMLVKQDGHWTIKWRRTAYYL